MLSDWSLAEIRTATPKYLYRLRPPSDPDAPFNRYASSRTPEDTLRIVEQVFYAASAELETRVNDGHFTREEAAVELNRLAMIELQGRWGLEYEQEEVP